MRVQPAEERLLLLLLLTQLLLLLMVLLCRSKQLSVLQADLPDACVRFAQLGLELAHPLFHLAWGRRGLLQRHLSLWWAKDQRCLGLG